MDLIIWLIGIALFIGFAMVKLITLPFSKVPSKKDEAGPFLVLMTLLSAFFSLFWVLFKAPNKIWSKDELKIPKLARWPLTILFWSVLVSIMILVLPIGQNHQKTVLVYQHLFFIFFLLLKPPFFLHLAHPLTLVPQTLL